MEEKREEERPHDEKILKGGEEQGNRHFLSHGIVSIGKGLEAWGGHGKRKSVLRRKPLRNHIFRT